MKDMVRVLVLTLVGLAVWPGAAVAEDTDLFMAQPPGVTASAPNVLIILDNSANWNAANQHWPSDTGKQGDSEIQSLTSVLGSLSATANVNVGLMMFTPGRIHSRRRIRPLCHSVNDLIKQ